jgi:hypothetical protein
VELDVAPTVDEYVPPKQLVQEELEEEEYFPVLQTQSP